MTACKLVVMLGARRRSSFELRGALTTSTGSVTSQLLARCRRSSLQDDARKQHEALALLVKASQKARDDGGDGSGECSHRSSISTVIEEDELGAVVEPPEDPDTPVVVELPDEVQHDPVDDCVSSLPAPRRREIDHRYSSPPAPSVVSFVPRRRKYGTILQERPQQELYLFREEAEYSDYVDARVTGVHTEMDSVVYYELDVHLSQMKWQVLRRFSEFRKLRQRLVKHLTWRQRCHTSAATQCKICANILQTLEQTPFPSRKQRKSWFSVFGGRLSARKHAVRSAAVVADRKHKLQDFVATLLFTVRGLRQHSRLMCDSSACEISVALRMIEEFLGLSFTRYMRFLNERGVLGAENNDGRGKTTASSTHDRRVRLLADAARRATVAV